MEAKIQVLVGPIAAGKSSYCKNAARKGYITVNDDAVINLVHGGDYTLYDKSLKILYKSIENNIIGIALAMNRTVVVDRGLNVSVHGRRRWLALAKSFDVPCEAIVFKKEKPSIHAKRRYNSDSRGHTYEYWLKAAQFHNSIFDKPSRLEEGFAAIHKISWKEIMGGKVI